MFLNLVWYFMEEQGLEQEQGRTSLSEDVLGWEMLLVWGHCDRNVSLDEYVHTAVQSC